MKPEETGVTPSTRRTSRSSETKASVMFLWQPESSAGSSVFGSFTQFKNPTLTLCQSPEVSKTSKLTFTTLLHPMWTSLSSTVKNICQERRSELKHHICCLFVQSNFKLFTFNSSMKNSVQIKPVWKINQSFKGTEFITCKHTRDSAREKWRQRRTKGWKMKKTSREEESDKTRQQRDSRSTKQRTDAAGGNEEEGRVWKRQI